MRPAAIWVVTLVLLLLFGLARLPFERSLENIRHEHHLHTVTLDISLRERIGQLSYAAALSGFRSVVAAFLWIEAHTAWEQTAWGRMAGLFESVTSLQPRSLVYWDLASWHMAWNASIAARENPSEPSEFLRLRAEREYQKLGRNLLERGIANNPDRYLLHERLGVMLRDKFNDHCGAAQAFATAAGQPGAPAYVKRLAAYELAVCPGQERAAYKKLRAIYDLGGDERKPSVIFHIQELENKLQIPPADRIRPDPIE